MSGLAEFKEEFESEMMFRAFQSAHPRHRPCHYKIDKGPFRRCWNPTVVGGIILCSEHGGREALKAVFSRAAANSEGTK